jgi:hypothetical protein
MMFDVNTKTTDIIMFNSRNLGALIVDEKPHVKSWDEPQYSIQNLGIEESYGFGVLNEGQAIAVAKNVKVRQNEMSTPARPVISIGADNTAFQAPSGLVGVSPFDVNDDNFELVNSGFVSLLPGVFSRVLLPSSRSTARRSAPRSEAVQCRRGFPRDQAWP